jgi:hypothetical protein
LKDDELDKLVYRRQLNGKTCRSPFKFVCELCASCSL